MGFLCYSTTHRVWRIFLYVGTILSWDYYVCSQIFYATELQIFLYIGTILSWDYYACSRIFYATVLHTGFGGFSPILVEFLPGITTYKTLLL
jgi:hypothetical protein